MHKVKMYNDGTGDVLGNPDRIPNSAFISGDVLQGFGLHNAGRFYTVKAISKSTRGRVQLEEHLTGRVFWTFDRYYRLAD